MDCNGPPRLAVVHASFNSLITDHLRAGARRVLDASEFAGRTDYVTVAGAWELPVVAARLIGTGAYVGVVALGCVIRGSTAHFDYVAGEAARGLGEVAARTGVPVTFGVLTTDTVEQALERAHPELGDKGGEAARTTLDTVALVERIDRGLP